MSRKTSQDKKPKQRTGSHTPRISDLIQKREREEPQKKEKTKVNRNEASQTKQNKTQRHDLTSCGCFVYFVNISKLIKIHTMKAMKRSRVEGQSKRGSDWGAYGSIEKPLNLFLFSQ